MKKIIILAAVAALALTGCASTIESQTDTGSDRIRYIEVATSDGGEVPCVVYVGYKQGGITCDWEATR